MSMDPSLPAMPGDNVSVPGADTGDEFEVDWDSYQPRPSAPDGQPTPAQPTMAGVPPEDDEGYDLFGDNDADTGAVADTPGVGGPAAQAHRGMGRLPSSVVGSAPVWSDWARYSTSGETYHLRVNRMGGTGKMEHLGDFPAMCSRLDIIKTFGPGTFLCTPIDQFGADLDLANTPYVLEIPPDHIYFQEQRRLNGADTVAPAPMSYGAGQVTDSTFAYLQQKDKATFDREMSDRTDLREREARLEESRADANASQFGMAAKTVDNYTTMVSTLMNQGATRSDAQARAEREWYNRSADRDREQMKEHGSLQSQSLTMVVDQARIQADQARTDLDRRESRMREERLERRETENREQNRREAQIKEERDRREARERQDRAEDDRRRAEERERERSHNASMTALMTQRMEASNPMNSLMAVGTMLVPALALAEKLGLVDAFKDRFVSPKEEEDKADGWAGIVKEVIKQAGEVGKVIMTPAMQLEQDDDEDDEDDLIEREDGLLQDSEGVIYHPDTEEEMTLEQAREWLSTNGRGLTNDEIAAAEAEQARIAEEAAVPEHVKAARAAHGDAYREVGGPAALAAMGREKYDPSAGGATAPAPTEPPRTRTNLRQHPADKANIPAADQAMARKLMVKLVEGLRKHPQAKWQALTISAVKHAPKALGGYLTATTIRKAAEEAGADDVLINKYIALLNKIEGPLAALIKDIPRG